MKKVFAMAIFLLSFVVGAQAQSNPQNEFDYVGKIHNEVLSKFIQQNGGKKSSISQVIEQVKAITLANADYSTRFGTQIPTITEAQVKEGFADYPNQFKNLIAATNISNGTKAKLNELLGIISNAQGKNSSYEEVYALIVAYEVKIKNADLPKNEKEIIFGASSVARYSSKMWIGEPNSTNGKLAVVLADIGGGILGGVLGGPGWGVFGAALGSACAELAK